MKDLTYKLKLILPIIFLIGTFLAVIAPVFAHFGLEYISDPIYWVYQWFCHQRPWRSYHMFDYQYALDARMITMFLGIGIGGIISFRKKLKPLEWKSLLIFIVVMLLPMAIDGITQMVAELSALNKISELPFYESTNLIRSITGIFAGVGMSLVLFPLLSNTKPEKFNLEYLKVSIISLLITFAFIPVFVFMWYVTSVKYTPSSIFFDSTQRFPGYNYEVTTGGGHSTIDRILKEPTDLYEEREIYYKDENNSK